MKKTAAIQHIERIVKRCLEREVMILRISPEILQVVIDDYSAREARLESKVQKLREEIQYINDYETRSNPLS